MGVIFCSCILQEGIGGSFFIPAHCRELSGILFLFLHIAGSFRECFFCSCTLQGGFRGFFFYFCTLQGGFGGSFFIPAHCREVSGVLFLFLHIAGRFRRFFFCSCTLQGAFGNAFYLIYDILKKKIKSSIQPIIYFYNFIKNLIINRFPIAIGSKQS